MMLVRIIERRGLGKTRRLVTSSCAHPPRRTAACARRLSARVSMASVRNILHIEHAKRVRAPRCDRWQRPGRADARNFWADEFNLQS